MRIKKAQFPHLHSGHPWRFIPSSELPYVISSLSDDCITAQHLPLLNSTSFSPVLSSVQSLSHVRLCNPMDCSTPGFPVHHQLPESALIYVHWVGNAIHHLILCRPLLLPPSTFPSIRGFSNESFLHIRWPKYWSFSFSISPSNEYSRMISFRMDWLNLLAVQGTLKSLLQHHSSKTSILWHSAFFMVQLWKNHSFNYMDLCWQSNVSAFEYAVIFLIW